MDSPPAIVEMVYSVERTKANVGEVMFKEREWDLFIQVFTLTDRMQHLAWYFAFEKFPEQHYIELINTDEIASEGERAIWDAYGEADNWVGSLLDEIDLTKDVVFLVSDHGFTTGTGMQYLSGVHRLEGTFVLAGGPVEPVSTSDYSQNKSDDKSVNDLTRNILYLMGLPVGEDMIGDMWFDLYTDEYVRENPLQTIPTYNLEVTEKEARHMIDPSALEQLKGLGYIDGGNIEGN